MPSAPSLSELQRAFAASLAGAEAPSLTPWIDARGIDPQARLRIYRHAGFAIHVDALEAVFPAVRALVGEDGFDGLATRFSARHGSHDGNLQRFGQTFAEFIQAQPETAALTWLPEVARLEWLRQETLLAAQVEAPLAADLLVALQQAGGDAIHLHLQPHVRVLDSVVPVLDLWAWALDPGGDTPDPGGPGQSVLLWRRGTHVHMQMLDADRAAFVQALRHGHDLASALAGDTGPGHLTACLNPLMERNLIARIATTPASPAAPEITR